MRDKLKTIKNINFDWRIKSLTKEPREKKIVIKKMREKIEIRNKLEYI
jgi:hypothetical protein